jgi:four helix bundle protein
MSGTYADLRAWQKAVDLVAEIYTCTQQFPRSELYGLTGQLRRAAVSVPSNIAEGKGCASDREFLHFLNNARGSLFEIETQIAIAEKLGYLDRAKCDVLRSKTAEIGRLLNGLMKAIKLIPAA